MANIDYKEGGYSIPALASQQFTFWWGKGTKAPKEYFDVSISPEVDKEHPELKPLVEAKKEVYNQDGQVYLNLTLRNENNFAVNFIANHVRIY